MRIELVGLEGIPEIGVGNDLAALLCDAAQTHGMRLASGDIVVVTQKIVSKAEGRVVALASVQPSPLARLWSEQYGIDPRVVELVLRESQRIVRMDRGVIVAQTRHGFVCANAGVDVSNVDGGLTATLLPEDPDHSAARLRAAIQQHLGCSIGVVITDTFGRPWREGQVNVAIGAAGFSPLMDYAETTDPHGYRLRASVHAVADEIAAAAGLASGKLLAIPVVIVRGLHFAPNDTDGAKALVRPPQRDLFR